MERPLFAAGAVRVDNNSPFGEDIGLALYPKESASCVVNEEPSGRQVNSPSGLSGVSASDATYSASAVRRLFRETGLSVTAAADALGLDEKELQSFLERGAPRWLVPAVIAVALVDGTLTASGATRLFRSVTRHDETSA